MAASVPWGARLRLLVALPGAILAVGLIERFVLEPRYGDRPPEAQIAYWERFTERHPDFPEGFVTLGQVCQDEGDPQCAGVAYARALVAAPSLLGDVLQRTATRRTERGSDELRVLAVLFSEDPSCLACGARLVNGLRVPGRPSPPPDVVARLAALGPEAFERAAGPHGRARFLLFAGRMRAEAGDVSGALALYSEVDEYDPELLEVRLHRGLVLVSSDAPAAIRELEVYRNERPGDVRATIGLALAFLNAGQPARARELVVPVVRERPEIDAARRVLERADAALAVEHPAR